MIGVDDEVCWELLAYLLKQSPPERGDSGVLGGVGGCEGGDCAERGGPSVRFSRIFPGKCIDRVNFEEHSKIHKITHKLKYNIIFTVVARSKSKNVKFAFVGIKVFSERYLLL